MYDNHANFFIYFSLPIVNSTKYTSVEQLISLHTSLGSVAKIYSNPATERASLKSDLSGKAALNRSKPSVPGMEVHITDLETNKTTEFSSIRDAAKFLGSDIKTILRRNCEKSQLAKGINTPYRGRYMITINVRN